MRLVRNNQKAGTPRQGSAGNQSRKTVGISGQEYDMSWVAQSSESADLDLGDKMCVLTIGNQVRRTADNIDERSSAEKMFSEGNSYNFGFSIFYSRDVSDMIIQADKNLDRYLAYQIQEVSKGHESEMSKSREEILKMAALREAKKSLRDRDMILTVNEWNDILEESGAKAAQMGISTLELSERSSTRDTSLKRSEDSTAWSIRNMDGQDIEAAVFNAAGQKTIPLFTKQHILKAKEVGEGIYKHFTSLEEIWNNTHDYGEITRKFCEICGTLQVPSEFKKNYSIFTEEEKSRVSKYKRQIMDTIERNYK